MERGAETAAGLALVVALAWAGDAVAAALALPVPGAMLGLAAFLALLGTGRFAWSLGGSRLLVRWLGLLIVPPLVAVGGNFASLMSQAWALAAAFVVGVAVTGTATALLFRAAGGHR